MPKKKKWLKRAPVWVPLKRAALSVDEVALTQRAFGLDDATMAEHLRGEIWRNDRYQVIKRDLGEGPGRAAWVWLIIRRLDRAALPDWRDFQCIKNQLVGDECEGVELYPAESRLVDTANSYHLWCCTDPVFRFPFGFQERLVSATAPGKAKQRPFGPKDDTQREGHAL